MLRQNSSHTEISNANTTAAELLQNDADIEALRVAYRAVVTASAHSVFVAKVLPGEQKAASEPLLNAYQAAVAAFANSVFAASGLPVNSIEHFQANIPAPAQISQPTQVQIQQPVHPLQQAAQAIAKPQPALTPQYKNHPNPIQAAAPQAPRYSQPATGTLKAIYPPQHVIQENLVYTPAPPVAQTIAPQTALPKVYQTAPESFRPAHRANKTPANKTKTAIQQKFPVAEVAATVAPVQQPQPISSEQSQVLPAPIQPQAAPEAVQAIQPQPAAISPATPTDYVPSFDIHLTPPPVEIKPSVQPASIRPPMTQIEEQAMQDALEEAMGPANQDTRMFAEEDDFMPLSPAPETWLVKLFSRPKLAAGIIGMCILSSAVYAGLGYWFLNNADISNAAEPVNMLNIQDDESNKTDGKGQFNNLDQLQNPTHIIVPKETEEQTLLAQAQSSVKNTFDEIASIKNSIGEPTGRTNPFAPLLGPKGEIEDSSLENKKKKDLLIDLQFIGFIGDINSKDKVAMIKVSDPLVGASKTVIKKAGDSFLVEGERVVLRGISKNFLKLDMAGESRTLSISPYTELADTSVGGATASTSGGANNASPSLAPSANGDSTGRLGNLGALSRSGSNPANPELQEPSH